jgi:hypothetical protein
MLVHDAFQWYGGSAAMSSSKNQKLCGVKDREASALKRFERIIMKEVETSVGRVNILSRHHME